MSAQSDDEGRPSSLSTGNHKHRYGFMPTRDLPQLKPTPSLAAVKHGLGALASAMGLGRTQEIYLSEASLPEVARNGDAIAADLSDDEPQRCVETEVESRFAQSWLTRIISSSSFADEPDIVDRAAEILAGLCGKSATSSTATAFIFSDDLRVTIRDSPVTADALGNRTWGAAPLLAQRLVKAYHSRIAERSEVHPALPSSLLELGAGTGLVALALKIAANKSQHSLRVDLTDFHPHVLDNLRANVELNGLTQSDEMGPARVSRLDWQAVYEEARRSSQTASSSSTELPRYQSTAQTLPEDSAQIDRIDRIELQKSTPYDVIIAADCVYDPHHPQWIRAVADKYLARPSSTSDSSQQRGDAAAVSSSPRLLQVGQESGGGVMYLISPLRSTHSAEIEAIYEAFPLRRAEDSTAQGSQAADEKDLRLCITWHMDEIGYDDFGPHGLDLHVHKAQPGKARKKGLEMTYRTFEVRWR